MAWKTITTETACVSVYSVDEEGQYYQYKQQLTRIDDGDWEIISRLSGGEITADDLPADVDIIRKHDGVWFDGFDTHEQELDYLFEVQDAFGEGDGGQEIIAIDLGEIKKEEEEVTPDWVVVNPHCDSWFAEDEQKFTEEQSESCQPLDDFLLSWAQSSYPDAVVAVLAECSHSEYLNIHNLSKEDVCWVTEDSDESDLYVDAWKEYKSQISREETK